MKIAAVLGSPHGLKGNTNLLLAPALQAAEKAGALVMTLSLSDYEVKPCRSCDICHRTGACPIGDDYSIFRRALRDADGIILATPNYMFNVTAQMKALLDRSSCLLHCLSLENKYAAVVVTSGGDGSRDVQEYLLKVLRCAGCWTVGSVGASAGQLVDNQARLSLFQTAAELGKRLCEAIHAHATFPDQQPEKTAFADRMKELILARKADWPFEYEHWKAQRQI